MTTVRSVHTRRIDAAPSLVGGLLDLLGRPDDPLWPADRWPPDMRVHVDGPLAEGVPAGHGNVHYTIDDYVPGQRLWFRFDDPGLVGRHGFDVLATEAGGTELVHTLEGRLEGAMRLAWPTLVRPMHDAYVEDMLDRAELASTGAVRSPARQPGWLRLWNRFDRWRQRWRPSSRRAAVAGWSTAAVLLVVAGVHGAWALGWRWPGGSDQAFADRVVGPGADLPSAELTWGVAAVLAIAATAVARTATSSRADGRPLARMATWGVAGVLGLRGAIGIVTDFTAGFDDVYEHLDLAIYSPLRLALAAGAATTAQASFVRSRPVLTLEPSPTAPPPRRAAVTRSTPIRL